MGVLKFIGEIVVDVCKQSISNSAFNAGANGKSPRVAFHSEEVKKVYYEGYRLGQEAGKQKLMKSIRDKIEE